MMRNLHIVPDQRPSIKKLFLQGVLIFFVFTYACKQPEAVNQEGLYGKWDIHKAERNGKETSYLRNGYFIIQSDGKMTINITGEDETGPYTLDKTKLMMSGDKVFEIQDIKNDSMTMKYVASPETAFIFYMQKNKDNVQ